MKFSTALDGATQNAVSPRSQAVAECQSCKSPSVPTRRIGKSHHVKARQLGRHIHLNVDYPSVNPEGRRTIGLCKQRLSLLRFKYKRIITQERGRCLMILCKKERFQTLDETTRSSLTKLTQFPAQNPSLTSLTGACIMKVNQPHKREH